MHCNQGWVRKKYLYCIQEKKEEYDLVIVLNGRLNNEKYTYISNWVVGDSLYDVILDMSWHLEGNVIKNYQERHVIVKEHHFMGNILKNPKPYWRFHNNSQNIQKKYSKRSICRAVSSIIM